MTRYHQHAIVIPTQGRGLVDATGLVANVVVEAQVRVGLCHVFVQHTSASLVIQENADPDVLRDLQDWLVRLAPDDLPGAEPRYRHVDEGPDDMSAHLRSAITATSLTVPVEDGRLALGRWQAIYLVEHRVAPKARRIVVTVHGV